MALSASSPAFAWYDNHRDHYYSNYGYGHSASRVVIVNRPATRVVEYQEPYYQTANYYQPATVQTTQVHCDNSFNPVTGIVGGALGGIAGNTIGKGSGRTAAIITGAVLGTTVGGSAGGTHCTQQVVYQSPPVQPLLVQSASAQTCSDNSGTEGRYCREYQNTSTVGGRASQTYGTACMQPDGSWEIVN